MVPAVVRIAPEAHRAMLEAARAAWPREVVGLVGGRSVGADSVILAFQLLDEAVCSEDHFVVPPIAFAAAEAGMRVAGHAWLGFVHSHPNGTASPSARDRVELWRHCLQLVVAVVPPSAPQVGAFWLSADDPAALPVTAYSTEVP